MQETEGSEPVVDGDDDDVAPSSQSLPAGDRVGPAPDGEATSVQPDHHRPAPVVQTRGPEVEHEALLTHRHRIARAHRLLHVVRDGGCPDRLWRRQAVANTLAHARPRFWWHRREEAAATSRGGALGAPS